MHDAVHPHLAVTYTREAVAEAYHRGRPGYPQAAIETVVSGLKLGPTSVILEVAAGTGLLTAKLEDRVGEIIAIEPARAMREILSQHLERARPLSGRAEYLPIRDHCVDAVVVGDAFHWFDPELALPEIARVLRPSGGLAVLKHAPSPTEVGPWFDEYRALIRRVQVFDPAEGADLPLDDPRSWRQTLKRARTFKELGAWVYPQTHTQTPAEFVSHTQSRAFISALDPETRLRVIDDIDSILHRHGVLEVAMHYDVAVVLLRRCSFRSTQQ